MTDLSKALDAPGVTGMAYNATDGLLYVSTRSGDVLRYNPASQTFLAPVHLGGQLSSIALSPDGSFLLVGHQDSTDIDGVLHDEIDRVALPSLSVTPLDIPLNSYLETEYPAVLQDKVVAVAIGSNGQALFTTGTNTGSDALSFLREFPAASDTVSAQIANGTYGFLPGGSTFAPGTLHTSDDDRYILLVQNGVSPIDLYDSQSDQVISEHYSTTGENNNGAADINDVAGL